MIMTLVCPLEPAANGLTQLYSSPHHIYTCMEAIYSVPIYTEIRLRGLPHT